MAAQAGESIAAIMRTIPRLRPLPEVATRVLQLLQDPDYEVGALIDIVRTDAALVARLLRLCNSARSGLGQEMRAIGDAVAFLGSRHLVQLVLATCSTQTFAHARGGQLVDPAAVWRHSLATAVACQRLCRDLDATARVSAFTVGILHGLGALALDLAATPAQVSHAASLPPEMDELAREREVFGLDHGTAAGLVAASWQLPFNLAFALRGHDDDATLAGADPLPAALHVGDRLAKQLLGTAGDAPPPCAPAALRRLALTDNSLANAAADAKVDLEAMAELLNLASPIDR